MTKQRVTPFNEAHELEYGLEIASRIANTKDVNSVRCKFCTAFGKEGRKTAALSTTRKRKVTENIKYFTRPFRVDNYKSHLKTHSENGQNINNFLVKKREFFLTQSQRNVLILFLHITTLKEMKRHC